MSLLPDISYSVVAVIRVAYGITLLAFLLGMVPQARRFFLSERWGGYARSSPSVDVLHNPIVMPLALTVWSLSALFLIIGVWTVAAALVSAVLARYYCIFMRWRGVLRGMGAPGFMTYWLGMAVFLLELSAHHASALVPFVLLALQLDLAFVFLAAGIYKVRSGYPQGEGMELGLVNPQWGYWWRRYRRLRPGHPLFRVLDHLAWSIEIAAALAMLFPPTRFIGGLLLIITFALIATQIRLALLCEMVMIAGLLFFAPDTAGGRVIQGLFPVLPPTGAQLPVEIQQALLAVVLVYMILLPVAYGGLAYNLYLRRRLGGPWQDLLERYTNFFGITLWRVFSADVVNFWIEIRARARDGSSRLLSDYRNRLGSRFAHVCEMIAITSVFTTLKYYGSRQELFRERLLRYARTLPRDPSDVLTLDYRAIQKSARSFDFVPVAMFIVDPATGEIQEQVTDEALSPRTAALHSPIHEGARPGSYAPTA